MTIARRSFLMTTLISGFTLATHRGEAAAIHTDAKGLVAGATRIPVSDGALPAYFARPAGQGPFPVILVTEEVFGVHEYIKDICRRFARLGYLAVAPEYFARLGDLSKMTDIHQILSQVISQAPDALMLGDMDHAAAWAGANHGDPSRMAMIGFCHGGRQTWLYAAHSTRLKAAVAFYGPLAGTRTQIQPQTAGDVADRLQCPLLALYGGLDAGIPRSDRDAASAKAAAAGKTVKMIVYPEAQHGFHADYRPSYDAAAAKAAWDQALAWIRTYGV